MRHLITSGISASVAGTTVLRLALFGVLGLGTVFCHKDGATTGATTAAGGFKWTATPTLEQVPVGPIVGEAQGKPFAAKAVYFEPMFGKWRLVVHEGKLDTPTSISGDGQFVSVELPEDPTAGKKMVHPMGYGGGYFQINKPDDPKSRTSWNASNAWAVEITKWDVKPYDEKASMFQQGGTASGKVVVCYQGDAAPGKFQNAWVAGTFENVPVRYMGKPSPPSKK